MVARDSRGQHGDRHQRGSYQRRRIVTKICHSKLRMLDPEMAYRSDEDLGNAIDIAVVDNWCNHEIWYEDDPAYGICTNYIVEISEGLGFSREKLYALVRDTETRAQIVVTIVDKQTYGDSIVSGKWKETKPERTRYRHVGDPPEPEETPPGPTGPTLTHTPLAALAEKEIEVYSETIDLGAEPRPILLEAMPEQEPGPVEKAPELMLLTYTDAHGAFCTTKVKWDCLRTVVLDMIMGGVNIDSVEVWTQCEKKLKVTVTLE